MRVRYKGRRHPKVNEPHGTKVERILMVVKTYPTPSAQYGELTCTAGVRLSDSTWIRIYPYPFRLIEPHYRFQKWDIIEAPILKSIEDPRPDSFKLYDVERIKRVEQQKVEDEFWSNRMRYIQSTLCSSVEDLVQGILPDGTTWGPSVLPVPVSSGTGRVSWQYKREEWTPKELEKLTKAELDIQQSLFASESLKSNYRMLRKSPYLFRLTFRDLTNSEYTMPVLDWEIYQLYSNVRRGTKTDEEALEKVRYKIEEEIFSTKRQVILVLGNIHHRFKNPRLLAVDGFIWPKRQDQLSLLVD